MAKQWYIIHVFSQREAKIEAVLRKMMEADSDFRSVLTDVKVPIRITQKTKNGKKKEVKEKVFPGYVLVQLDFEEAENLEPRADLKSEAFKKYTDTIRRIDGVTGFVSIDQRRTGRPLPISKKEFDDILRATGEKVDIASQQRTLKAFEKGEEVTITSGSFSGFEGVVEEFSAQKQKVKVVVKIFGRPTSVEMAASSVEKLH